MILVTEAEDTVLLTITATKRDYGRVVADFTAQVRVQSQASQCETYRGRCGTWWVFLRVHRLSAVSITTKCCVL